MDPPTSTTYTFSLTNSNISHFFFSHKRMKRAVLPLSKNKYNFLLAGSPTVRVDLPQRPIKRQSPSLANPAGLLSDCELRWSWSARARLQGSGDLGLASHQPVVPLLCPLPWWRLERCGRSGFEGDWLSSRCLRPQPPGASLRMQGIPDGGRLWSSRRVCTGT